jgi:phosphoesterase RecJ-like protein
MIDHHQNQMIMPLTAIRTLRLDRPAEMLYNFISFLGKKEDIDKTIGTCIYTEFLRSGSFSFRNHRKYHRIAELIDLGVENTKILVYL